jgi:hypothetical protein
MRAFIFTLLALLFGTAGASAQDSAYVQTIHTIIDPTVDVWARTFLGDQKIGEDFEFRTATRFVGVNPSLVITFGVAPENSTSFNESIFTVVQSFEKDRYYSAFVKGTINDPSSLEYILDPNARPVANDPSKVDISVFHASPDAPAVDVAVRRGPRLFADVTYGEFTPYVSVDPGEYLLDIKPAGSNDVVATYRADLSGLTGQAIRVFASGYLSGQAPAFGLFVALADGTVLPLEQTSVARLQVIHNSPTPTVDVYVNGDKLLDSFVYRTATSFIDVPGDVLLNLGVAVDGSVSVNDTIANFPVTLENAKTYIVTASGIVGDLTTPFTLNVNDMGREASTDTNTVQFAVLHGATDAPAVDVEAFGVGNLVTNLSYGEFTDYLSVAPGVYRLRVKPAGSQTVVARFEADLSGLKGGAAYVFASGLLAGSPDFGLFAALADGTVLELPAYNPTARLQVIHNSPSPTVDVYANGGLLLDNFVYRTATPFIDVPADALINLGVALETSASVDDTLVNFPVIFEEGKTYVVAASGIVGNPVTPFTLNVNDMGREVSTDTNTVQFAVLHGATDAPAVDVEAFGVGNLVDNLSYGEFTDYLSVAPGVYRLRVKPAGSQTVVARFEANLSGLKGGAAYVFASGLLAGSPDFGLFAALADGTVVEFPAYSPTARLQVIHNSPSPTVDVYANGGLLLDNFVYRTATPFIDVTADALINIGVALETSASVNDTLVNFPVTFEEGKTYVVTASGIVGNLATPFTLIANDMGREAAVDNSKVDFAVLHGATDAPAVDVDAAGVGNLVSNLSYGEFTGYLSADPASYTLVVRPAGQPDVVGRFTADLSGLQGGAAYVFASGLLAGSPDFGLFAALPNGDVVEFPVFVPTARLQVIHNSPSPTVDVYANGGLLLDNFVYRTATPFIDVPAEVLINLGVALETSASVNDTLVNFPVIFEEGKTYVVTASGIVGDLVTPFTLIVNDGGREASADVSVVDISVLHGATNAPAVDVDELLTGNVVANLPYGSFTDYLSLPPALYDFGIRAAGSSPVLAAFRADLSALGGGAATVFASGLLGGTPAFGLFAALPDGTVLELPLTPTARIQVIHNSPNPTVDVYAGSILFIDDFAYRTATPYVDVPADRGFEVGIAFDNSTSVGDVLASFPVNFPAGGTFTVFAGGVLGNPATPFTLFVDGSREAAVNPAAVEFSVHHGATNAPAVDVDVFGFGPIITDLAYGEFTPFLAVPPDAYLLVVRPTGQPDIVGSYLADLSSLQGGAARVFASGLLGGTPGFGLFAALPDGTVIEFPQTPLPEFARIQIIHNSPSPVVDVYIDGGLALDDFEYRTATSFATVPAGVVLNIGVAPGNSNSVNDTIANFQVTFEADKTYYVLANGIVGNPTTPFTLDVYDNAREAAVDPTKLELAVHHGSPNAPNVDITLVGSSTPLLSNVQYGDFADYLSLTPASYFLDVETTVGKQLVGTWGGNFSAFANTAGLVYAGGLVGDDFELLLALPDGTVFPLPSYARTQVIHNSPSPVVDVYYNNGKLLEDFEFRTATNFGLLPAGTPFTLAVAPGNSTTVGQAIYSLPISGLQTGRSYTIMASGVVGNSITPFQLFVSADGQYRSSGAGIVALNLFHGSPDAPGVDVKLPGGPVVFDNVDYSEFTTYVQVPAAEYLLDLTPANDNSNVLVTYRANLTTLGGQAATAFASGFFGGATPGFEVWVALTDGTTFPLPVVVNTNELDNKLQSVKVSPNPVSDNMMLQLSLSEQEALRYGIRDVTGRLMQEGDFGTVQAGDFAQRLDVSTLPAGFYQLELVSDGGVRALKFAVQR